MSSVSFEYRVTISDLELKEKVVNELKKIVVEIKPAILEDLFNWKIRKTKKGFNFFFETGVSHSEEIQDYIDEFLEKSLVNRAELTIYNSQAGEEEIFDKDYDLLRAIESGNYDYALANKLKRSEKAVLLETLLAVNDTKTLKKLFDNGFDINQDYEVIAGYDIYTPLSSAAADGKLKLCEFLIDCGAEILLPHKELVTPINAIKEAAVGGHIEVFEFLLNKMDKKNECYFNEVLEDTIHRVKDSVVPLPSYKIEHYCKIIKSLIDNLESETIFQARFIVKNLKDKGIDSVLGGVDFSKEYTHRDYVRFNTQRVWVGELTDKEYMAIVSS